MVALFLMQMATVLPMIRRRRDHVTGEMWKEKQFFRLCLNKAAREEIIWHCKHYTGRGVMKFFWIAAEILVALWSTLQKCTKRTIKLP